MKQYADRTMLPHGVRLGRKSRLPWTDPRDAPIWTPRHLYTWEKAVFTVPAAVSEERVQFAADRYRRKFGNLLEHQGFTVLGMDGPHEDRGVVAAGTTDPDRRRYYIYAKVTRRPVTFHTEVPDEDVPLYQAAGFKLTA